jgi:hypothetical protein
MTAQGAFWLVNAGGDEAADTFPGIFQKIRCNAGGANIVSVWVDGRLVHSLSGA